MRPTAVRQGAGAAAWLLVVLCAPAALGAEATDGDYAIRIEAPFSKESPQWLPMRISVRVKDGKPLDAFATAMQLNVTWHEVDVSGLTLARNAFDGGLKVALRHDDFQAAARAIGKLKRDPIPVGFTSQPIRIKCPVAAMTGDAPGEAVCERDLLHFQKIKPPAAEARAWREAVLDPAKPRYIELYLPRWADDGAGGTYDGMYGNASVLIRGEIVNGKVGKLVAIQGPERYQLQYADLAWSIPRSDLKLDGDKLSGELTLAPSGDPAVRDVINKRFSWRPLPETPVKLQVQGKAIGTMVAATAQVTNGEKKHESRMTGHLRSYAFTLHADRTPRAWRYTAAPGAALIEAARKEALAPIRPGERGKRAFWSDWVRFGGFDYFIENGRKIVQTDRFDGPILRKIDFGPYSVRVVDYDEYTAKPLIGWNGSYHGIAPPSFDLKPVAGAARYRFTVDVVPPPRPAPVLAIAPDANYRPGKGVRVDALAIGKTPDRWLVSDAIKPMARDDFVSGGLGRWRPDTGTKFTVAGVEYGFRPFDAGRSDASGNLAVPSIAPRDTTACLFTVLRCEKPMWVRLTADQRGRGGVQSFLAGQEPANRIVKLSPGLYPWLIVLRAWGPLEAIRPRLEAVPESEVVALEKELAAPVPQSPKFSAEFDQPWKPLTELWQKLPPAAAMNEAVTMEPLDSGGKVVGAPVKIPLTRYPHFQGPYFKLPRTYRQAAILSARWMRDNPVSAFARVGVGYAGAGNAGGDGQLWYTNYCTVYAGLVLAQLADDPTERSDALELAIVAADTWLRSFMSNYLPDTYKGWAFDQWVYGTAWLDLYRLTGDRRYRDAAMLQCKRLAEKQLPTGTWTEVDPVNGHVDIDPNSGRPWNVSIQGPTMQQWDPSSVLYLLGRARKELKTDEFRAAEDKAYQWVMANSLAKMDWRKQGPHASEDHRMPWLTIPDCALHFFNYLALDLPGRAPDWDLMADLLRWCEDRDVDWRRINHPTTVYPRIIYTGKNRDTQLRLALAYAVLGKHSGNPLHRAKAEALAGAMLVAQFPTTGQIPHFPDIDTTLRPHPGYSGPGSGDGGNRGEYATMALFDLAALWEPDRR